MFFYHSSAFLSLIRCQSNQEEIGKITIITLPTKPSFTRNLHLNRDSHHQPDFHHQDLHYEHFHEHEDIHHQYFYHAFVSAGLGYIEPKVWHENKSTKNKIIHHQTLLSPFDLHPIINMDASNVFFNPANMYRKDPDEKAKIVELVVSQAPACAAAARVV